MPVPQHSIIASTPRRSRAHLSLAAGAALLICLGGGCSAVDNFNNFRFGDGGSDGGATGADALPSTVGAACGSAGCGGGLTCLTTAGGVSFPGGMCSRPCDPGAVASCPTGSQCAALDNGGLCLPSCDTLVGPGCRQGYACCRDQRVASGPGACAPASSGFCNH